jgi:hypothetical protein
MRADVESGHIVSAEQPASGGGFLRSCWKCFFESSGSSAAASVRMANMGNAILLVFAGVWSLLDVTNLLALSISFYFLAAYLVCFGTLLCCFECRLCYFEARVRDSFGFLYTYAGRCAFLLFMSTFCFGLISKNETLGIVVGVVTALNALFNMVIIFRHGKLFEDPTMEYSGTAEGNAAQFLQQNPNYMRSAVSAGVSVAQSNPELARQGLSAGAQYARENPQAAAAAYRSSAAYS